MAGDCLHALFAGGDDVEARTGALHLAVWMRDVKAAWTDGGK